RSYDEPRIGLSDSVCTGLQLANFCQDVARDRQKGRVYLPGTSLARAGYTEAMLAGREFNEAFRQAMCDEVDRAERYLRAGAPLVERMPRSLGVDVALFVEGGLAILRAIRELDYNVWKTRPVISKGRQLKLLAGCWWRSLGSARKEARR
ncbi:MAG: squalene/phytoene synthase family protein, partial [Pirellulales bacterium]